MKEKYISFEVRYPSENPTEEGRYFGKSPIYAQALNDAKKIGGSLYGITESGKKVFILY